MSVLFKCPRKPWQCDSEPARIISGPSNWSSYMKFSHHLVYYLPVLFILSHVKMSSVTKAYDYDVLSSWRYTHAHTYTQTHTHIYIFVHTHNIYFCLHIYIHIYTCIHIYTYKCVYVCLPWQRNCLIYYHYHPCDYVLTLMNADTWEE